jgi:hypothetical protein
VLRKLLSLIVRAPQSDAALANDIQKKAAEQERRLADLQRRAEALGVAVGAGEKRSG